MYNNQFSVDLYKDRSKPRHLHPELELLYVVEGSVKVSIKEETYTLEKEDVILINSSLQHGVNCDQGSVYCIVHYDYQVLVHMLKKPNSFFVCNSSNDKSHTYDKIKKLCWALVYQSVISNAKTDSMKYSILYQILDVLIEKYLPDDDSPLISENYDADEKLQMIIHYVHQNYKDGVSLSNLAKDMYTSTSTLSRLFKKQTGTYFADYVNQVRIRYAVDELLYTEKNMTKIAMDCGFSNASAFTKAFREIYRMAPTEYRQKMKNAVDTSESDEEIKKELLVSMKKQSETQNISEKNELIHHEKRFDMPLSEQLKVSINVKETVPYEKIWNKAINIGAVSDLNMANIQYHLNYLKEELGFKYVRMWSLFSTQLRMTNGVTVGVYNFDMLDVIIDYVVSIGMHPWFDLTRRPNANIKNASQQVWFEDENIQFKNRRSWEAMYEWMLKHFVRRYGMDEVKNWIFEIGRDPFHAVTRNFYQDKDYDFRNVYKYAYLKTRELIPEAKIGYSAGPTNYNEKDMSDMYDFALDNNVVPDFVSFILFPYIPSSGGDPERNFTRTLDPTFELSEIKNMRKLLEKHKLGKMPIWIAEWNPTVSSRNFLNDSCFRGACLCRKIADLKDMVEVFGIWVGTDWISNSFDAYSLASGSAGIITKDKIRKPIFFALKLLNRLGKDLVAIGENYIVTKRSADEYEIICFNLSWFGANYFMKAEDQSRPEDVEVDFDSGGPLNLKIELTGLSENCGYMVKKRTINANQGSFLDEWKKFDYDYRLERNDIKYLQEICIPQLGMFRTKTEKDRLTLKLDMMSQEITSFHIFPTDL